MNRAVRNSSLRSSGPGQSPVPGTSPVAKVKEILGKCTAKQLKEVEDYLAFLKSTKSQLGDAYNREDEMLYHSLEGALVAAGITCPPYVALKRDTKMKERFKVAKGHVDAFVKRCNLDKLTTPQRKKLYTLFARLVVEYAVDFPNAPLSMQLVLGQMEKLPGLFDKAFPGYVASGLVGKIL